MLSHFSAHKEGFYGSFCFGDFSPFINISGFEDKFLKPVSVFRSRPIGRYIVLIDDEDEFLILSSSTAFAPGGGRGL